MNLDRFRQEIPPVREELPAGGVLLRRSLPAAHSVALGVWLRTGSQDEEPSLSGLAHFLEHMVFKGSVRRSAFEIARSFDGLGADVDSFASKDVVAFTLRVLPQYLGPACEVLADLLLHPALQPEMIALEQEVVCEEIQEALDNPEDRLHNAFAAHLFRDHPRGQPILGTPETVRSFGPDLLRREHARLFSAPNVVISLAGDVDDRMRDLVKEYFTFGSRPDPVSQPFRPPRSPEGSVGKNGRLVLTSPIVQTYFEIGNLGISYRHRDRIPLFLLTHLLGGGMSSRLLQAVREREGLAYSVFSDSDMGRDVGLVSCAGSCSPGKTARLVEVVRQEYARLGAEGVGAAELADTFAQIKSQLVFGSEGVMNQMYRLAKDEIYFGRSIPLVEIVDQIDAVDPETIKRCAREYFDPDHLVVAVHGPE